ncbi:response regulator [Vallicoccus soli]|uniref:DNA-binding response regulator n=1 Tax=Vallicoccus soli TaxID=2339232 RepID=A0A3A3YXQ7_9ACTN|nr:response regulator transcription factor [Vallicoccus soli]RJK92795.1 DNA-binding response regulator [Vallicoccus soli]
MTTPTPPAPGRPVRVLLLDDHEIVRRGLKDLLQAEPGIRVVAEAGSVAEARGLLPDLDVDVAVLDGRLPDGSGIDVCRDLRSAHPDVRALILTSYDDEDALFAAIMAGASGYLLKQVRGNDLVAAVRAVAEGRSLLDPAVTARVLDRVRGGHPDDRLAGLTERERKVLELVAEGLTNRQIAAELFLAEKTVKNHVSNLLAKLGLERRTQAAVLAATLRTGGTPRR